MFQHRLRNMMINLNAGTTLSLTILDNIPLTSAVQINFVEVQWVKYME